MAFVWLLFNLFATVKHSDNLLRGFTLEVSELARTENMFLNICSAAGNWIRNWNALHTNV